jgi:5-methylcytosine-specific restriction endonuclease McrA
LGLNYLSRMQMRFFFPLRRCIACSNIPATNLCDNSDMPRGIFKYDWELVQRYYDEGHGYVECRKRFGFAKDTWIKAVRRRSIIVRPRQWTISRVLQNSRSRYTVKRRLLNAGILKNVCEECGLFEWRGRPISIQLDHRNGIRNDHRLENLRMLCPNCHSQTETYAARNRRRVPPAKPAGVGLSEPRHLGSQAGFKDAHCEERPIVAASAGHYSPGVLRPTADKTLRRSGQLALLDLESIEDYDHEKPRRCGILRYS